MASDRTKSMIDTAAEIAESVLPQVQSVLAAAFTADDDPAAVADAPSEASSAGASTPAKPRRKRAGTWLGLLILGGLAAAAAVLWKRMQEGSSSDNWESSYTPPAPVADEATDAADNADAAEQADEEAANDSES